jgi:hypothetical protein
VVHILHLRAVLQCLLRGLTLPRLDCTQTHLQFYFPSPDFLICDLLQAEPVFEAHGLHSGVGFDPSASFGNLVAGLRGGQRGMNASRRVGEVILRYLPKLMVLLAVMHDGSGLEDMDDEGDRSSSLSSLDD